MQEHKFTKGPWTNETTHRTDDFYHYIQAGSGWCGNGEGVGFTLSGCMSKADAQLIAAAPDLFNALKSIFDKMQDKVVVGLDQKEHIAAFNALNKALGKK